MSSITSVSAVRADSNYTGEPIYSYMIGKDAGHNQVLISQNDHPQISPRKPGWGHNDPGSTVDGVFSFPFPPKPILSASVKVSLTHEEEILNQQCIFMPDIICYVSVKIIHHQAWK